MATNSWERIRSAEDYRSFLRAYLEERELNLSDLARAAGYGRSYPSDVIKGKRRLTARSCHAFENALKLPSHGRKLFRLLVAREEPDNFPEFDPSRLPEMIESLRARPWGASHKSVATSQAAPALKAVFGDPRAALVFAACGQPGQGASLADVEKRTRLAKPELEGVLRNLSRAGLVRENTETKTFEPSDLHLFVTADNESRLLIDLFQGACLAARHRVQETATSDREFFFSSVYCVREERLPELKRALRETIVKFIDESIDTDGDRMVRLLTALHF